jgi:hypothetical protein
MTWPVFSPPLVTLPPDVVARPCACGLWVTASRTAPTDGVSRHNRTPAHRAWWVRVRGEWQGEEAS